MPVRIVRLGTPREKDEGVRLGTVRRPPRGVPKAKFASDDWYDVWLPNLAPSQGLMDEFHASTSRNRWNVFARKYEAEMKKPDASRILDALAALSHTGNFSAGCYCEDESHCHRSILRKLLAARGADIR